VTKSIFQNKIKPVESYTRKGELLMLEPFFHGFILALGLILPLGVQNIFVFNQGVLQPRFVHALPAIITASLCDTLLILVSVLGVSFLILDSFWIKMILIGAGCIFLFYMGWTTWNSKPSNDREVSANKFSLKNKYCLQHLFPY
jgi:L-lysine exporter family protein LysE/ArgO